MVDSSATQRFDFEAFEIMRYFAALLAIGALLDGAMLLRRPAISSQLNWEALGIDFGLVLLFGLQHSLMARRGGRILFVICSAVVIFLLVEYWQDSGPVLWVMPYYLSWLIAITGIVITGIAAATLGALELIGLRDESPTSQFREPILHRYVRHPIYLGNILLYFAVPIMTWDRLLLAVGLTVYILIGIQFEERGLVAKIGQPYRDYQRRVPMLLPWP